MMTKLIACDNCQNTFERNLTTYESDIKRGRENFFCGRVCFNEFQSKNKVYVCCDTCHNRFKKRKRDIKSKNFCSKKCYGKSKIVKKRCNFSDEDINDILHRINELTLSEISKMYNTTQKILREKIPELNIALKVKRTKHIVNAAKQKTNKLLSKTKGELFQEKKTWQSARGCIQTTSRRRYLDKYPDSVCHICGYKHHVDIAHIKSISEFNDADLISELTDPDNCLALCPNHHWEFDNDLLNIGGRGRGRTYNTL